MLKLMLFLFCLWMLLALYIRVCRMYWKTDFIQILSTWFMFAGVLAMIGEAVGALHGHWLVTGHIALVVGISLHLIFDRREVRCS